MLKKLLGVSGFVVLCGAIARTQPSPEAVTPQTAALLGKYCVTCHNERRKTAGLMIDTLDLQHVDANAETWEKKGITPAERFRYLYSRDELSEWVPRIREAAQEAKEVHLMFNNCYANYGTTNAREIADLLAEELGG